MGPLIIGIDVGATSISGGLVTPQGQVMTAIESPTRLRGGAVETLLAIVDDLVERARHGGFDLEGIGVGLPGLVDVDMGMMVSAMNLVPELAHVPLAERLQASTGVPAFVENDVNALAVGQLTFGLGRGARSLAVVAVGTGVGGALVLDGRLVRGHSGCAGEFGHLPVERGGPPCVCGRRGCLNQRAGGRALAEAASRLLARGVASSLPELAGGDRQAITAALIFEAARCGDRLARALVDKACGALGVAVGTIINVLDPGLIIITGGVAASLARFEEQIRAAVAAHALVPALAGTSVRFVPADKRETVRGGAALVLHELNRRGERPATVSST
jgi:glucokinase